MRPLSRKTRFSLIGLIIVIALYAALGFLLVPTIAHRQIEQRGSAALGRNVTLEDVRFNPFTFNTELDTLRVADRAGGGDFLSLERARLNFDAFESLVRWQWRFGDVTLTAPVARLAIDEAGELNIADLFGKKESDADAEPGGIPEVGVDRLVVEGGSIEFVDRSRVTPFTSVVEPVAFTLENFSTAAGAAGSYRLAGSTRAGETFTWSGRLTAAPFSSQGRIEFTSIDLPSYQPFLADVLAGEIRSGRADLVGNYELALGAERRALLRDVQFRLANASLALPQAGEPAVTLPSLDVEVTEVDMFARSAHVTRVALDGLAVAAVRDSDGTLDLTRLIVAPENPSDDGKRSTQPDSGETGYDVRIDRFALQNGRVQLTDRTADEPVQLLADQIAVTLTGVSTDPVAEAGIELALRWQEGPGTLTANGTATREPLKLSLQVTGSQLELEAAAPYLRQFADLRIISGRAELEGRVEMSRTAPDPLALRWTGRLAVDELATRDRTFDHDLVQWSRLAVEGIDLSLAPTRFAVQGMRLEQPVFHLLLGPEGKTNLAAALGGSEPSGDQAADAESPTTAEAESPGPEGDGATPIVLENLVVTGGRFTLIDRSGEQPFETSLTAVEATLRGLSTERNQAGELQLTATVLGSAPATLQGDINLIGADALSGSNLDLELRGVGLDPLQPYIVRFLGHRVQQGRMQGDFGYKLSGGMLEGNNHVVLDNFYLGEPVESPDALGVPIKLALAVLRNRDGQVVLDVPVSGSLKSPEFSFADAIRGAFRNVLGKIATAPFALLGSMFGAPDTDLSQAEFPAGQAEFSEDTQRKLDVLARALQDRPTLKLIVHWQPTPEADREALRQHHLGELIQRQREQLAARTGGEVTEAQALRALYAERIGGVSLGDAPAQSVEGATAETDEERAAWYARFWRWFWGPWPEEGERPGEEAPPADASVMPALPDVSEEAMRQELLASMQLEQSAFEDLARSRAEAARNRLAEAGVAADRIEVARDDREAEAEAAAAGTPMIRFELQEAEPALPAP